MKQMLSDFGLSLSHVPIKCDHTSAINISKNPIQHFKPKHIKMRHHFLKHHAKTRDINLKSVGTKD